MAVRRKAERAERAEAEAEAETEGETETEAEAGCGEALAGGEVVEFGAVGREIVEFPRALAVEADEFPVADTDGGVAFVFPENCSGRLLFPVPEVT